MASYVESALGAGERIEFQAKTTTVPIIINLVLGLLTIAVFGLGLIFWIVALVQFLRSRTTELAITNKKVIAKFGIIGKQSVEMFLHKVETVRVEQGLFGRMLNYGSVVVSGGGIPHAPIPMIQDPMTFRRRFMEVQEQVTTREAA